MSDTAGLTESQRRGALTHPDLQEHSEVNRDILKTELNLSPKKRREMAAFLA